MPLPPIDRLASLSDSDCLAFRDRLVSGGYDANMMGIAESIAPSMFDAMRVPLVLWSLKKRNEPGADLARLFAYADALDDAEARRAFGDELLPSLFACGLLARDDRGIRSTMRLLPAEGVYVVGDEPTAGGDVAMSPGPTTQQLMGVMPRDVRGSVLDVGCGPGTMALFAAKHGASRAVGVDINARAIEIARFNARLNGVRAEFRVGDLLAPVAGERFDLVVAQPPYVIQPADTPSVTYLHGGAMGDELTMRLLRELPANLEPGGTALVLFDSAVRPKEPLHVRVRKALGEAKLDLLILAAPGPSPDQQSLGYGSVEAPDLGKGYGEAVVRYREHLAALGITEVSHALVAMRAPADATASGNFSVTLPVPKIPFGDPDVIPRTFAALDLAGQPEGALARAKVRGSSRARWIEERPHPDPNVEPKRSVRFQPGGIATDREITEAGAALISILDESPSVEQAVGGYAEVCGASPAEVRRQVFDFVREGLARGLLEPG